MVRRNQNAIVFATLVCVGLGRVVISATTERNPPIKTSLARTSAAARTKNDEAARTSDKSEVAVITEGNVKMTGPTTNEILFKTVPTSLPTNGVVTGRMSTA
jgi:hypothetical protein